MELEELMGDTLPLKPIEVDEEQQRLLLSNRRAGGEERVSSFKVGARRQLIGCTGCVGHLSS